MSDIERVRRVVEDVYVRDLYMVRDRVGLSPEFHDAFRVLMPQFDGQTGLCRTVSWESGEALRGSNPKAVEPDTRFEFPSIDVAGDAAVAKVVIRHGDQPVYTDYVSLYRVDGEWRIVSKLFWAHRGRSTLD